FYGGLQGRTLRQSSTVTTTVPVEAWRRGDFSGVAGLNIYDPATGTPDTRQQFANNQIPSARFTPIAQKLLPMIPLPNQPGLLNNLIVNTPFRYNGYGYDGRVDHVFNDST